VERKRKIQQRNLVKYQSLRQEKVVFRKWLKVPRKKG
jgi:hypothetical protein